MSIAAESSVSRLAKDVAALVAGLLSISLLGESKFRRQLSFDKLYQGDSAIPNTLVVHHALGDELYGWRFYNGPHLKVDQLDSILCRLEGESEEEGGSLFQQIDRARLAGETSCETRHVDCRWHANGNLHLRLRNPAHVRQLNALLAECYPPRDDHRENAA